jgi:hypothetical protein
LQAHLQFCNAQKPNKKLQKSLQATARQKRLPNENNGQNKKKDRRAADNSGLA